MRLIDADELLEHLSMVRFMDNRDYFEVQKRIWDTSTVDPNELIKSDIKELPTEPASILFRPICSCCGRRLVNKTIDCVPAESLSIHPHLFSEYRIEPSECPYCHSFFETIEIPGTIPYTDHM